MNKKLQARLKAINERCSAIVASADADNEGMMSAEQQTEFDALTAEYDEKKAQLGRIEALNTQTEHLQSSAGRTISGDQPRATIEDRTEERVDPQAGFQNMADFGRAVQSACVPAGNIDDRLQVLGAPVNFHNETGSEGYEVPPAFRQTIFELVFGNDDLLSMVDSEPTDSNSVEFLADETTPWGSAGVQAAWEAEGSQLNPSKLATNGEQMKLHKLNAFVLATDELMSDAPRLASRLTGGAARAINWKANQAIIEGSGVGQPLGYNKSNALVTVAKESGQTANSLIAKNVARMFARMIDPANAHWRINSDVIPELMTMTVGNEPIWTSPTSGFAAAPGGFLFGRPIQISEHNDTLGKPGDIEFVNPHGYYAPMKRGGIQFASSIHLYFDYNMQAFRWTFRMGGQPYLSKPVQPNKGASAKSHFVNLALRN